MVMMLPNHVSGCSQIVDWIMSGKVLFRANWRTSILIPSNAKITQIQIIKDMKFTLESNIKVLFVIYRFAIHEIFTSTKIRKVKRSWEPHIGFEWNNYRWKALDEKSTLVPFIFTWNHWYAREMLIWYSAVSCKNEALPKYKRLQNLKLRKKKENQILKNVKHICM